MKRIISFLISLAVGIGIFILVLEKIGIRNILQGLGKLNPFLIILAIVIFLASFLLGVRRWQLILKIKGYHVSLIKLLAAKLSSFTLCYVTPIVYVGGEWVRSYILKREANVPNVYGLSSILIDKLIETLVSALILILGAFILILKVSSGTYSWILAIIMLGVPIIGCLFLYSRIKDNEKFLVILIRFFGLNKIKYINSKNDKIHQMEDEVYTFFRNNSRTFWYSFLIGLTEALLILIVFKILLFSLSCDIAFFIVVLIRALSILVSLIPVPAALGVYEGSFAYAFSILGLETHTGFVFSLIIRCFYLLIVGLGTLCLSHFGVKLTRAAVLKEINNKDNNSSP